MPNDPIFPFLVAVRWVHFASMTAVFGGALFWLAAAAPAVWPRAWQGTQRLLRLAAPLAALSGLGWEMATVSGMGGDAASLLDPALLRAVLLDSPFGPVLIARLAGLAVLTALVFGPKSGTSDLSRSRLAAVALVAALLLASQARLGHAAGAEWTRLGFTMMLAYTFHILAVAAWVGALPPLLLALREALGTPDVPLLPMLRHVSILATCAVAVLVVAGAANATFRLDNIAELTNTSYGRELLAKLGLTAAMLTLAAVNRRAAVMARAASLSPNVVFELVLGVLVLGLAAILGVTPPPR